jgi:hypothetical protein
MSKRAVEWAETVHVANGPMRRVLDKLAYLHHDKHDLYPSQAYLAEKTQLSIRAVRYALQLLTYFGIVQRKARSNGARGRSSDLRLLSFGLHNISKEQISAAKIALRKPRSNRHAVPVADINSQEAPCAGPPGTACQGIGELIDTLSQNRQDGSVEHCTREAEAGWSPKIVIGGRS